ncbi:hypothetical protein ACFC3F_06620 [Microbacterium sp. NPDC055910]|uniref:hypothetical protein n=1 Tax=Microbacterium sp. NPDC055910 TaxID=3345659 RepID=UPI0035E27955
MNPTPAPPPAPNAVEGLRTSLDSVLKLVLSRLDPSRATPISVREALAAAGVQVREVWAGQWLDEAREIRRGR